MTMARPPTIHTYNAREMTEERPVELKLCNLRLHSAGVFSNVYRGQLIEPERREIAMKKTWPGEETQRNAEVDILMALSKEKHLNIVQVLYTMRSVAVDQRICESMIFDFMPANLASLIKELPRNLVDIKLYTWQLFNALYFLYKRKVCHRDVKPPNILVDPELGLLKLGDFGSAKVMKEASASTAYQVTRFYRPPELLLGAVHYGPLVDVWSGGCVLGEMLRGAVLLPGRNTRDQLRRIIDVLGVPTDADLVQMRINGQKPVAPESPPTGFGFLLPDANKDAVAFLQRILVYNPKRRRHGSPLLNHSFFHDLLEPGLKRKNGQLVADTPIFKDITEMIALHRRQQRLSKEHLSTAEDHRSRESLESRIGSAEALQKRSRMGKANSRERVASKEKTASKEKITVSAIKKPENPKE